MKSRHARREDIALKIINNLPLPKLSLFRGILGRYPSLYEIRSQKRFLFDPFVNEHDIETLLRSQEFWFMRLGDLVARSGESWNGRYVAFVHIPKTGGTSITYALAEAIGVPPLWLYERNRVSGSQLQQVRYWPLIVGHRVQFAQVPENHFAFTVLREPRSRILSMYRQYEEESSRLFRGHIKDLANSRKIKKKLKQPFSTWLRNVVARPRKSYAWFFDSPEYANAQSTYLSLLKDESWENRLKPSIERMDGVAWLHHKDEFRKLISEASGADNDFVNRNVRREVTDHLDPIHLSHSDLNLIEKCADVDWRVIALIAEKKGLPDLPQSERDMQFYETCQKLEVKLP